MRRGIAHDVEPAPASRAVHPALGERALRVAAHEQVVGPGGVIERIGMRRARDVRLAAVMELGLVAGPAPRTRDQQHRSRPISARHQRRRARRSARRS